jgi:hypothetical protein
MNRLFKLNRVRKTNRVLQPNFKYNETQKKSPDGSYADFQRAGRSSTLSAVFFLEDAAASSIAKRAYSIKM